MAQVRGLMRSVKNSVMNYDDAERRVREATSNDSWGASSSLMSEIANDTSHRLRYKSTLNMLTRRLTDYSHIAHVHKSLILVEYLLKNGDQRFVSDMRERRDIIKRLKKYRYFKDDEELGENVRRQATKVVTLIDDREELRRQRDIASRTRGKIHGISNTHMPASRNQYSSPPRNREPERPPHQPASSPPQTQKKQATSSEPKKTSASTKKKRRKKKKKRQSKRPVVKSPRPASGSEEEPFDIDEPTAQPMQDEFFDEEFAAFEEESLPKKSSKQSRKKKSKPKQKAVQANPTVDPLDLWNETTVAADPAQVQNPVEETPFDFGGVSPQADAKPSGGAEWFFETPSGGGGGGGPAPEAAPAGNSEMGLFDIPATSSKPKSQPKQESVPVASGGGDIWGELTNLDGLGGGGGQPSAASKPAKRTAKKGGPTLGAMGAGMEWTQQPQPMRPQGYPQMGYPAQAPFGGPGMQQPFGMGAPAPGQNPFGMVPQQPFGAQPMQHQPPARQQQQPQFDGLSW